ncbi:hypothetical protein [Wohlfahrtiimonas chitiniclastica]|uniref:hypothetical protein n=1 Tax=Wohlfahrtiimonas chitiniclastica TaxID=400946 RepID=UPI00035E94D9|nr:hypothetical protein [Wohlfahrtiimonas chitiniclastica]
MKKLLKMTSVMLAMYGAAVAPAVAAGSKIADVFSYDMIGVDIAYLENLIGPARKTDQHTQTKTYLVDHCPLDVQTRDGAVDTLSVTIGGKCQFVLNDILPSYEKIPTRDVVFGLSGPVTYYADCFGINCGNAYDPSVYELYEGSHAENWRELLLSSVNASYEAVSRWSNIMEANEGVDWMMDNRFNCTPNKYRDVAEQSLKGQPVDRIMIGYNLEQKADLKWGCEEANPMSNASPVTHSSTQTEAPNIPFQLVANVRDDYQYIGSKVLSGQLLYEPNDMDGYRFEFQVDPYDQSVLPEKATMTTYVLDGVTVENAGHYFGIKTDLTDPKFESKLCAVTGPVTLQIVGITLPIPPEAHWYANMNFTRVLSSGPFRMGCEEQ